MGLPLERWARQATLLEPPRKRLLEDLDELARYKRLEWRNISRDLEGPTALEGLYAGLLSLPPSANLSTKTSISGEVGLLTTAETQVYLPLPAAAQMAPSAYRVTIAGTMSTSTSPGNLTITPRMGTTASGITLGASSAYALVASISAAAFYIHGDLIIRSIGAPGTNSTAIGIFNFMNTSIASPGPAVANLLFGLASASYDASIAQGLWFGLTHTVTTVTYIPIIVNWTAWN